MSNKVMLLIDSAPFEYTTKLVEASGGEKFLEVEGRFQHADLPNGNGRIYPRSLWEKVLTEKGVLDSLTSRSMLGELDHPESGKTSLKQVSHIVTELRMLPTGEVVGKARILNNPMGEQLKAIFEAGGKVGISSRGSGSVKMGTDGNQIVQEDFKLNTFDFVTVPSTPNAFPTPVGESKSAYPSTPIKTEEKKERTMNSLTRLAEMREQANLLLVAAPKNTKQADSILEAIQKIQYDLSRLLTEDVAASSVAKPLEGALASKVTSIIREWPEADGGMGANFGYLGMQNPAVMGITGMNRNKPCGVMCQYSNGMCVCPPDQQGKCSPGCVNVDGQCKCPDNGQPQQTNVMGQNPNDVDGDGDVDKDDKKKAASKSRPCQCGFPGCNCAAGTCKCAERSTGIPGTQPVVPGATNESYDNDLIDIDIDSIIAELEQEEQTMQIANKDRRGRVERIVTEAHNVASGLVVQALAARIRELIASKPAVQESLNFDEVNAENSKLREENERMKSLLGKLQTKMQESVGADKTITALVETLMSKDADAGDWKDYLLEAKSEADLNARHARMKAQSKHTDPTLPNASVDIFAKGGITKMFQLQAEQSLTEGVDLARRTLDVMRRGNKGIK